MRRRLRRALQPAGVVPPTILLVALWGVVTLGARFTPPFSHWHRLSRQPILSPTGHGFESAGVFNPAVVQERGEFVMLYRAQDSEGTSRLGYATSTDGTHFTRRSSPVLVPETSYERPGGVEDPRLVKIGDAYYLTYTGYNGKEAQLCLAVSRDLLHWQRRGVILPAYHGRWNVGWTKAGAIVDQKIGGRYWMYFQGELPTRPSQIGVAYSDDLVHWQEPLGRPVLQTRPGYFDSKVVEPGPPPVIVPQGILLIYNGTDTRNVFAAGWALFDKRDPARVLARSGHPILRVEERWEKVGQVPNVIFAEGLVCEHARWLLYYGAADRYIGVTASSVAVDPEAGETATLSGRRAAGKNGIFTFGCFPQSSRRAIREPAN
jgi:beta-1,2-mannosidase